MKHISQINPQADQTDRTKHSDDSFKSEFAKAWRMLNAFGKVHADIGSTDFRVWLKSCREFTTEQIWSAVKKSQDHKGYLDLAQFRAYCRPDRVEPSHKEFLPAPSYKPLPEAERRAKIDEIRRILSS